MEDHGGLKRALSFSWGYSFFQNLVGAQHARKWIAENFWQVSTGQKIVDMGCGPGQALDSFPQDIFYIGFDINKYYIDTALERYSSCPNALFFTSSIKDIARESDSRLENADLVLCNALLHHLDDAESMQALRLAKEILAPGGRLFCLEAVFLLHQDPLSRWVASKDRGLFVRTEQEWKRLFSNVLESFSTLIVTGLLRIPYTHIIMEYHKPTTPF